MPSVSMSPGARASSDLLTGPGGRLWPASLFVFGAFLLVQQIHAQPSPAQMEVCARAVKPEEQQRCRDIYQSLNIGARSSPLGHGWTLVRSKTPNGEDSVSVNHLSEVQNSDAGLAGLSLRCGPRGIETTLILLEAVPQALAASPHVSIKSTSREDEFDAANVNGGNMLLLPPGASELAASEWGKASELSITISAGRSMHGVISVVGLSRALDTLRNTCPRG